MDEKLLCKHSNEASRAAVYKSGTGTRGRGRVCGDLGLRDARRGTWGRQVYDAGTRGRQKLGRRGPGMIIATVGGKCDISFFVKMCYLWSTLDSIFQNHIGHLMMFTQNISL